MTRRVILDANGVKVAPAGFHADTALPYQLQFSSDFCFPGLVMRGTRLLSTNDFAHKTINIPYGRTLDATPMALLGVFNTYVQGSNSYAGVNWTQGVSGAVFTSHVRQSNGNSLTYGQAVVTPKNDRLEIKTWQYTNSMTPKAATIHYAVFSYTI